MPPNDQQFQSAVQQLVQGVNTMQMQAGMMPGGVPAFSPPVAPPSPRMQSPAEFSRELRMNYLQDQMAMQYTTPRPGVMGGITPVFRPTDFENSALMNMGAGLNLPGSQFGSGINLFRQQQFGNSIERLQALKSFAGFTTSSLASTAIGAGIGTMVAPGLGTMIGGAAGIASDFLLGDYTSAIGEAFVNPMLGRRERAARLQAGSNRFVRSGRDLSVSGVGMSARAAQGLERSISGMARDPRFQTETYDMFNREDLMRITQMAGQVGMLDQSQNAEQIRESVGKISRALANFMRIAGEPDVQNAMNMMGRMRQMGMNIPETQTAVQNARTFARMAGMTTTEVVQAGTQGANFFQQLGMSAASGQQAGMAATGMAGLMSTQMRPRTLNLLGGTSGLQRSLTQAAGVAGQMDHLLMAVMGQDENGRLIVDENRLAAMMSGNISASQLTRVSSDRMRQFGFKGLQDVLTRAPEIRDQLQEKLGGEGSLLFPMQLVRMVQRDMEQRSGRKFSLEAAGMVAFGGNQQMSRTIAEAMRSPELFEEMRRQREISYRENQLTQRQKDVKIAEEEGSFFRAIKDRFSQSDTIRGLKRAGLFIEERVGGNADLEELRRTRGGGELMAFSLPARYASDYQKKRIEEITKDDEKGADLFIKSITSLQEQAPFIHQQMRRRAAERTQLFSGFTGQRGTSLSEFERGSPFSEDVLLGNEPMLRRGARFLGQLVTLDQGFSPDYTELNQRGRQLTQFTRRMIQAEETGTEFIRKTLQNVNQTRDRSKKARGKRRISAEEAASFIARGTKNYIRSLDLDWAGKGLTGANADDKRKFVRTSLIRDLTSEYIRKGEFTPEQRAEAEKVATAHADELLSNKELVQSSEAIASRTLTGKDKVAYERTKSIGGGYSASQQMEMLETIRDRHDDVMEQLLGIMGFEEDMDPIQARTLVDIGAEGGDTAKIFRAIALSEAGDPRAQQATAIAISQVEDYETAEKKMRKRLKDAGFTRSDFQNITKENLDKGDLLFLAPQLAKEAQKLRPQMALTEFFKGDALDTLTDSDEDFTKNLQDLQAGLASGDIEIEGITQEQQDAIMAMEGTDEDLNKLMKLAMQREGQAVGETDVSAGTNLKKMAPSLLDSIMAKMGYQAIEEAQDAGRPPGTRAEDRGSSPTNEFGGSVNMFDKSVKEFNAAVQLALMNKVVGL